MGLIPGWGTKVLQGKQCAHPLPPRQKKSIHETIPYLTITQRFIIYLGIPLLTFFPSFNNVKTNALSSVFVYPFNSFHGLSPRSELAGSKPKYIKRFFQGAL